MLSNIGLNLSSLNYYTSRSKNKIKIIKDYIRIAKKLNITGLEFYPSSFINMSDKKQFLNICSEINDNNLFYILDCNKVHDLKSVELLIKMTKFSKKKVVVIILTKILECKRHLIDGSWDNYIKRSIKFLKKLEPLARDNGIKIAIENHQDFDSNDFLKITDNFQKDDTIGINFDIGNALAVCEDPMTFCKKIIHKINNVHIKDYIINETKEGFLLSNCSIGKGSVDLEPILKLINKKRPNVAKMVEPGQLKPRHIKKNPKIIFILK